MAAKLNFYSCIKLPLLVLFAVQTAFVYATAKRPNGYEQGQVRWQLKGNRSDDFTGSQLNTQKWQSAPKSLVVGAWTFDKNNAYLSDGKLNIKVTQDTHVRKFPDVCLGGKKVDRALYYKSGAVQSYSDGVYGFYEAKIKGVKVFPGLSPAFWLYSDGHPFADRHVVGSVDYSEIDIVELQQADWHGPKFDDADPINVMDHNLHARIVGENGKAVWKRPKAYPAQQLLRFEAPFDPSEAFHTYAVENRKDRIFWYVDGELVGSKENLYWHRPMHVIFSMGLRRQFIKYNPECQRADPNPASITSVGFPEDATMQVDYVKVWQAQPSVWLEYQATQNSKEALAVTVHYHGGSGHHLLEHEKSGLTLKLVEKNRKGLVKTLRELKNIDVLEGNNKHGGKVEFSIKTDSLAPSKGLPEGHYYVLIPSFKSSNGSTIWSQQENTIELIKAND